jgi:hypothetical protein
MIITVDTIALPTSSQKPVFTSRIIKKVLLLADGSTHTDIIATKTDISLSYGYLNESDLDILLDIQEDQKQRTVVYQERDGSTSEIQAQVEVLTWQPRNIYAGHYQNTREIKVNITEV